MPRLRLSLGLLVGCALLLGCGSGSSDTDVVALLTEFRTDEAAAKQKYKGRPVRIKLDKVNKTGELQDAVLIDGMVGKIGIWAIVTDKAEGKKALALKLGESITVEGEIDSFMSTAPALGLFQLKPAKVVP